MNDRMKLSKEQEAILNGSQGEVMAKVMETLVATANCSGRTGWCRLPASIITW